MLPLILGAAVGGYLLLKRNPLRRSKRRNPARRRVRRSGVTPGGAGARLAKWRWHHNPTLSAALRKRLMEWRSPSYPAIKALAQSKHPATEAHAGLRDLSKQYERADLKKGDLAHLKKTITMVTRETGVRSNPRRR